MRTNSKKGDDLIDYQVKKDLYGNQQLYRYNETQAQLAKQQQLIDKLLESNDYLGRKFKIVAINHHYLERTVKKLTRSQKHTADDLFSVKEYVKNDFSELSKQLQHLSIRIKKHDSNHVKFFGYLDEQTKLNNNVDNKLSETENRLNVANHNQNELVKKVKSNETIQTQLNKQLKNAETLGERNANQLSLHQNHLSVVQKQLNERQESIQELAKQLTVIEELKDITQRHTRQITKHQSNFTKIQRQHTERKKSIQELFKQISVIEELKLIGQQNTEKITEHDEVFVRINEQLNNRKKSIKQILKQINELEEVQTKIVSHIKSNDQSIQKIEIEVSKLANKEFPICDILLSLPTNYSIRLIYINGNPITVDNFVSIDQEENIAQFLIKNKLTAFDYRTIDGISFQSNI